MWTLPMRSLQQQVRRKRQPLRHRHRQTHCSIRRRRNMATVSGGDRWAQRLREIAVRLGTNPEVKVGFFENSTYPDGTSVPMVAAINEFGAPSRGQPPRPFMRNTIAKHRSEWPKAAAALLV